jgi:hypothetical protein
VKNERGHTGIRENAGESFVGWNSHKKTSEKEKTETGN